MLLKSHTHTICLTSSCVNVALLAGRGFQISVCAFKTNCGAGWSEEVKTTEFRFLRETYLYLLLAGLEGELKAVLTQSDTGTVAGLVFLSLRWTKV